MSPSPSELYDSLGLSARAANIAAQDDDPEEAARALDLSDATGVPAPVIHADTEGFEKQHKIALSSSIIDRNVAIASYLRENPLAPSISHDDLGALDHATRTYKDLDTESKFSKFLSTVANPMAPLVEPAERSFMKGFGNTPFGSNAFKKPEDLEFAINNPLLGSIMALPATAGEAMGRPLSGILQMGQDALENLDPIFGNNFSKSMRDLADFVMIRGDQPVHVDPLAQGIRSESHRLYIGVPRRALDPAVTPPSLPEIHPDAVTALHQINDILTLTKPYTDAGVEPPVGLHPTIDKFKADQAKVDGDALDEALKATIATATRDRSGRMSAAAARQVYGDRTIGISSDAVRRLYGDELPSPDDGKLGWVPDLQGQLEAAETYGGDVRVPLADWLGKVDPAVAKELHDDIRVRDGGMTIEETKNLPENPAEAGGDIYQGVRTAAGFDPMFALGDRKIKLQRMAQGTKPGVEPSAFGAEQGFHDFDIMDHTGSKIGSINISEQKGGKQLYVDMIQAGANRQMYDPNFLGPSLIRDLLRQLKAEFPNAESITGHRVSGARERADSYMGPAGTPVVKFDENPQGWGAVEPMRELLRGYWERKPGLGYEVFRGEHTLDQQTLSQAVENAVRQMAPKMLGDVVTTPIDIRKSADPGATAGGVYQRFANDLPRIVVSLEKGMEAIGLGRHEAIHHLRKYGFINEAEWSALSRAARDNDWLTKHGIGTERYKGLDMPAKLEEAIAEEYRAWAGGRDTAPAAHPIFEKIKQFFEQIRTSLKELTGQDLTWEEIFKKIESGEIGGREGTRPLAEGGKRPFEPSAMERAEPKAANDVDAKGGQRAPTYDAAARKQEVDRYIDKNTHVGDFQHWQNIAEEEGHKIKPTDTYANAYAAARAHSRDGKTTLIIDDNGRRVVYRDGIKVARELNRDVEGFRSQFAERPTDEAAEKNIFSRADAVGMNAENFKRYMDHIADKHAQDLKYHQARALEDQKRKLTKEWKDAEKEVRGSVEEDFNARPDVAVDSMFGRGNFKLDPEHLTAEQQALLPKDYISARQGVRPDDIAGYFGYHSGDALVERLGLYNQARLRSGMSKADFAKHSVDAEVARQMSERFPDLQKQILEEAKDQAISETQVNILHEETFALAQRAGIDEVPLTKAQIKAQLKDDFGKMPVGSISKDEFLAAAGRAGRRAEDALLREDYQEAFREKQKQFHATIHATYAKQYEKARASLDRTAKVFSKREVPSVEPEYLNHIQDLLRRVGYRGARSVANIAENIERRGAGLEDFINNKLVESWGYRDMYFADFLSDPAFRKPVDELTAAEFSDFKKTVDSLVKNGRSEQKVFREGETFDRKEVIKDMKGQVRSFDKLKIKSGSEPGIIRNYIAGSTAIPTLMNRFDRNNARGLFHKFVVYPLTRAANAESRLEREMTVPYRALPDAGDLTKLIDKPPMMSNWRYDTFTRENLLGLIQNAGNRSNWVTTARGWGANPGQLMNWLIRNSTKADWERAQQMGDTIFGELIKRADNVYENLNGATIDKLPLEGIHIRFPNGEEFHGKGFYHPLIPDATWKGKQPLRGGGFEDNFGHIATSNGYTRSRTGAIYPVDLSFAQVPKRIKQMIHDISFREPVLEVQKIFRDSDLHNTITQHYGKEYAELLLPYLEDIAGKQGNNSKLWSQVQNWSEYFRQNTIGTYIGFNPYTVAKHAPTAFIMSARDVGPQRMASAYAKLFGQSPEVGLTWYDYAVKHSEELQRRDRHWQETFAGAQKNLYGNPTIRERVLQWGSWPVALSDKMSAVPLWIARFEKSMEEGSDFGEAVDIADRSVSRQHGSTAITNQPALVRGGGPLHGWLTSVYGFFGTVMQRRIEMVQAANDAYKLGRDGEIKAAAKQANKAVIDFMMYVMMPTAIEEYVTSLTTENREGWGEYLAKASAKGVASSFLYLRDLVHAFTTGQEPGVGLLSSPLHDLEKSVNDMARGRGALNRQHAGKTVDDFLTTFGGEAFGIAPKTLNNAARFGIDYLNNQAKPKGPGEVLRGITRGDPKRRVEK